MNLWNILPVRNEGCFLGFTLRAMLGWCDGVVVLLHACTDDSREIAEQVQAEHGGQVVIIQEDGPTWYEMSHRQRLLQKAREAGATHVATVDADEFLVGSPAAIRSAAAELQPGEMLQFQWVHLWRSLEKYRVDGRWARQHASAVFGDAPNLEWHTRDGYDHHHREPFGIKSRKAAGWSLLHFQHASWPRLTAKQALYQQIEVLRWPGRETPAQIRSKYMKTVDESGAVLLDAPPEWWHGSEQYMRHLDIDREPWQAAEVRRLIAEHGAEKFAGLDLLGFDVPQMVAA